MSKRFRKENKKALFSNCRTQLSKQKPFQSTEVKPNIYRLHRCEVLRHPHYRVASVEFDSSPSPSYPATGEASLLSDDVINLTPAGGPIRENQKATETEIFA